jgi:hypothetical protein
MERAEVLKGVLASVVVANGYPLDYLGEKDTLTSTLNQIDQFWKVSFMIVLEEYFDIEISDEEMEATHTIGDVVDMIHQNLTCAV